MRSGRRRWEVPRTSLRRSTRTLGPSGLLRRRTQEGPGPPIPADIACGAGSTVSRRCDSRCATPISDDHQPTRGINVMNSESVKRLIGSSARIAPSKSPDGDKTVTPPAPTRRPIRDVRGAARAGSAATAQSQRLRCSRCAQGADRSRSGPPTGQVRLRGRSAGPSRT